MNNKKYGKIYVDMDGVLVDFMAGAEKVLGHSFDMPYNDKKEKIARKATIASHDNFWANLDPMKDAFVLWNYINRYDPNILTAYPTWDNSAKEGKWDWVKKHLTLDRKNFFPVRREEKQNYAVDSKTGLPNILIDDYQKNIDEFNKAGGIGIRHINAKLTIYKLKELGFK